MTDEPLAVSVARARIEEVQPLAGEYRREAAAAAGQNADGGAALTAEPPLPAGALFWLATTPDGQSVGYAAGTLRPEGLLLGPVFVRAAHRRSGVAMKLLAEIERWASTARIPLVEVSVAADNEPGIRFLERAGYTARRVLMSRDGQAGGPPR